MQRLLLFRGFHPRLLLLKPFGLSYVSKLFSKLRRSLIIIAPGEARGFERKAPTTPTGLNFRVAKLFKIKNLIHLSLVPKIAGLIGFLQIFIVYLKEGLRQAQPANIPIS
jgi:hypothetical protein